MAKKTDLAKKYMEKLQISFEEAMQLVEDDADDFIGDEGEEMTAKAKEVTASEKPQSDDAKKKRKPKERKVDEEKGYILKTVSEVVAEMGAESLSLKTETELSFIFNGNSYTLKLTKHRPPKEARQEKMKSLTRKECPNTRVEFVAKWNADPIFRAKAENKGFKVMFDNVIFPNGKVATPTVKQGALRAFSVTATHTTFNRGQGGFDSPKAH